MLDLPWPHRVREVARRRGARAASALSRRGALSGATPVAAPRVRPRPHQTPRRAAHDRRWRWWAAGIPGRRHEAASGGVGRRRRRVGRGRVDARARQNSRARLHSIVVALIIIFFFLRSSFDRRDRPSRLSGARRQNPTPGTPYSGVAAEAHAPSKSKSPFVHIKFQFHREELHQPSRPLKVHGRVRVLRANHLREVHKCHGRLVLLHDQLNSFSRSAPILSG